MSTILCDASPLIFLAKIDCLKLIAEVLPGEICVLRCVADEVRVDAIGPAEASRLARFFEEIRVIEFEKTDYPSQALSTSDRSTLSWAIQNRPDWLVADERLVRRIAVEEGLAVIGVLGILFRAARTGLLTRDEVRTHVDALVGKHDFRISVSLYQRVMSEIESL